ncbi:MAG: M20/M25/M40 family metallo-hydrolase [Armatimonadota bacterium]|nr:M20/M25/M40 family metallo-hydrolase [Armatimonadota bacterium]MDR7549523.1 M20/M25/M40 family metallo-hydrolase [Armatimonadota bacterium]
MRMRRAGSIPLAVLAALALLGPAVVAQPAPSGDVAFAHVQHLAGVIGPRAAGTPSERQAADYLAAHFRHYGYPVEFHAFKFPFFEARRVEVVQLGPSPRAIAAQAFFFSASTPPGGIEADVVFVGLGRPADFEEKPVRGAVALSERGAITFREKVANAAARGALAVVVYNNQPGIVSGTLGQRSEIPAVSISQDEGQRLAEAAQQGRVRLRVVADTVFESRPTVNVVATKRGGVRPDEIVVVGGHYDSVPASPGANDNASGVAATLEAARVLAGVPTARTVQFVLFAAEELGLYGSRAFAEERRQGVVAMINLDMVGWGQRLMVGTSPGRDDAVVSAAERVAQRLGIPVSRFRATGSDHVSFEQYGIRTVFLHRGVDPHYHQPTDVPANVTPAHLEEAARLVVGLVQELSQVRSARPLPAPVRG